MCSLAVDGEYAIHFPEARVEELRAHGHPLPIPIRDGNRPFVDQEVIQQKVEEGDYLLIIAGDQLERRAVRLSNAVLGRHVIRGWDLALVEVAVFEQKGNAGSKEYVLVPHLGGALAVEQRHVVHVVIDEKRTRVEVGAKARSGSRQPAPFSWC